MIDDRFSTEHFALRLFRHRSFPEARIGVNWYISPTGDPADVCLGADALDGAEIEYELDCLIDELRQLKKMVPAYIRTKGLPAGIRR